VGARGAGYNHWVATEVPPEMTNGKAHHRTWTRAGALAARSEERRGGQESVVELTAPARPESLQLARMTAAYVAAQADLVYDDVQDLRLAIDELCMSLLGGLGPRDAGRLTLRFCWDDRAVEVHCTVEADRDRSDGAGAWHAGAGPATAEGGDGTGPVAATGSGAWARQILEALVDDHAVSFAPGRCLGWLRKQRVGAANP